MRTCELNCLGYGLIESVRIRIATIKIPAIIKHVKRVNVPKPSRSGRDKFSEVEKYQVAVTPPPNAKITIKISLIILLFTWLK